MDNNIIQSISSKPNKIDIIYWIGLNNQNILKSNFIANEHINAFDGENTSLYTINNKLLTYIQQYRSEQDYRDMLSYLEIINIFSKSIYKFALILKEALNTDYIKYLDKSLDDIKYLDKSVDDIIKNAPTNWEIIILNYTDNIKINNVYTLNIGHIQSASIYIINKMSAVQFINPMYKNNRYILDINRKHVIDFYLFTSLITYIYN